MHGGAIVVGNESTISVVHESERRNDKSSVRLDEGNCIPPAGICPPCRSAEEIKKGGDTKTVDESNIRSLCDEKRWEELANILIPLPRMEDDTVLRRGVLASILHELSKDGLPTEVMFSLCCVICGYEETSKDDGPLLISPVVKNEKILSRHGESVSVQKMKLHGKEVRKPVERHLSSIASYLCSSARTPKETKLATVRLLIAAFGATTAMEDEQKIEEETLHYLVNPDGSLHNTLGNHGVFYDIQGHCLKKLGCSKTVEFENEPSKASLSASECLSNVQSKVMASSGLSSDSAGDETDVRRQFSDKSHREMARNEPLVLGSSVSEKSVVLDRKIDGTSIVDKNAVSDKEEKYRAPVRDSVSQVELSSCTIGGEANGVSKKDFISSGGQFSGLRHKNAVKDSVSAGKCPETAAEESPVIKGGEAVASFIMGAARWFERGLATSVPVVTEGIDATGRLIKENLVPEEKPLVNRPTEVVTLTYTGATKRATGRVRESAQFVAFGIRDASTRGISKVAKKFEDENLGEELVQDKDMRDVMVAAGKVGLATLGAAAIVGEALFDTTKAVAQKTASVTADVVRHKYGDAAGRVVEDTTDSAGNILRTITHVGTLEVGVLKNVVAKNVGKVHSEGKDDCGIATSSNDIQTIAAPALPLLADPISDPENRDTSLETAVRREVDVTRILEGKKVLGGTPARAA